MKLENITLKRESRSMEKAWKKKISKVRGDIRFHLQISAALALTFVVEYIHGKYNSRIVCQVPVTFLIIRI